MRTAKPQPDRPSRVNQTSIRAARTTHTSAGYFLAGPAYRTTRTDDQSDWLILATRDGGGRMKRDGQTAQVKARSVAVYLAHAPQDYATDRQAGSWTFAFSHIAPRADWARWVGGWPQPLPGLAVLTISDERTWAEVWSAMTLARQLLAGPQRGRENLAANAIEAVLLWADEANPSRGPALDPRVRQAAELARSQVDRPVSAQQLARAAGLSVSRLTTLFREQLGESPVGYAERLRLEHAATLLGSGGLSVKETAAACGYGDPFHFSRRFTIRMGRPPSHFRPGAGA
jgi:AraC family transcriptional regulator of arabinose operon